MAERSRALNSSSGVSDHKSVGLCGSTWSSDFRTCIHRVVGSNPTKLTVVQWLGCRTYNHKVVGSNPTKLMVVQWLDWRTCNQNVVGSKSTS